MMIQLPGAERPLPDADRRARREAVEGAIIFRFAGDRLINETVYYDHAAVVRQLTSDDLGYSVGRGGRCSFRQADRLAWPGSGPSPG